MMTTGDALLEAQIYVFPWQHYQHPHRECSGHVVVTSQSSQKIPSLQVLIMHSAMTLMLFTSCNLVIMTWHESTYRLDKTDGN